VAPGDEPAQDELTRSGTLVALIKEMTMAKGKQTSASAASKAGKTLASKTATPAQKSAAASALTQMGSSEVTSKSAASKAGKTLGSKGASKTAKSAAASALSQRPSPKK
jgi:hypothetical protein